MKRLLPFIVLAILLFGAIFLWGRGPSPHAPRFTLAANQNAGVTRTIDLDNAVALSIPQPSTPLAPAAFQTPDGKRGWVVRLPGISGFVGGLPLPTPAYDDGKLFLGGGFGSSDFYAINASTGDMIWHEPTSDEGPTAASVDHGNVAFNTQSCSLMVMDENNGQTLWKQWLGDPLVSQPAVSKGRVYASFPNTSYGDDPSASAVIAAPPSTLALADGAGAVQTRGRSGSDTGYSLLCADVKHGGHIWQRTISAEVISAPAIVGDKVYLACFDGTVECLEAANGDCIWTRRLRATSAPVVGNGKLVVTVRVNRHGEPYEGIVRLDASNGRMLDRGPLVLSAALYLNGDGGTGIDPATRRALDTLEGFPSSLPISFEVGDTPPLFDLSSVTGAWAYQGSRVELAGGRILDAQGAYVNAVSDANGAVLWRAQAVGKAVHPDSQVFSPPALGQADLYLASGAGDLIALKQSTGDSVFAYKLGHPIASQPILAGGNIYVSTSDGLLICFKTGSQDASGWPAWGGNAQHDKAN